MRKHLFFISMMYAQLALAQSFEGRMIDMKFGIVSPEDGRYFKLPALVDVKINAVNLGPDTLCEGDTIYYGFKISTHTRRLLVYKVNRKILPGESVIISDTITFKDRPSPPWTYDYGSTFCQIYWCFARNRNAGLCKPINIRYDQTNGRDLNNSDTTIINYTNAQSSTNIISEETSIFPQPFSKGLTIRHHSDIKEVLIKDLSGRVIFRQESTDQKSLYISAENLAYGIYFLHITDAAGRSVSVRILKSHE